MASTDEKVILNGREVSPPPAFASERKTSADVAKILARSHDADEAMKAFTTGEIIEVDEATNKRQLRIINWHLMPIMCVVYGINYLDKTTISYTSIMGLNENVPLGEGPKRGCPSPKAKSSSSSRALEWMLPQSLDLTDTTPVERLSYCPPKRKRQNPPSPTICPEVIVIDDDVSDDYTT